MDFYWRGQMRAESRIIEDGSMDWLPRLVYCLDK